ncbi:Hypothetical protein, putative [Bodo saltans]|uniref:Ubiquitin-like domain-containing protein n=1 Tax=Bodo saltans TaxID=75058 RepID=A0A0S4JFF5_BODSA|nr:Hypothetical protein, putative [Bodo saltans]|eukprot:CUG88880.1 Hypothetical protein, putative [Bodo saltans]
MGKRNRSSETPEESEQRPNEVEEEVPLAIHSRSRRTIRQAQDFLVANASLYNVTRMYGALPLPRRSESPSPVPPASLSQKTEEVPTPPQSQDAPLTQPSQQSSRPSATVRSRTPPPVEQRSSPRLGPQRTPTMDPPRSIPSTPRKAQPTPPPPSQTTTRGPPPASDDTMLDLSIATLSGRQANVRILAGRSVNELAARMETLIGVPLQQIRFKCNGVDLPSGPQSLRSVGVRSGDHVFIRLDTGASSSATGVQGARSASSTAASPFKQRTTLFGSAASTGPQGGAAASPFKELPSWLLK